MNRGLSTLEMISALIATPSVSSVTPSLDMGNMKIIELLATWLEDLDFTVDVQAIENCPDKANLIASMGHGEDGLVLAGHTDTVPFDEHLWKFDPFKATESSGRLYGLGTSDMKSFMAIAISAAARFSTNRLKRPLTLLATADEETTMDGARLLADRGLRLGRYCLIGEPTNLLPIRQHKGILMEAIHLTGHSGHSSDPALGNSALEGMHAVIQCIIEFRREMQDRYHNPAFDVPFPTLNLGHIFGGDSPNRICGECELHIDLRPLPGMDMNHLRQTLRDEITKVASDCGLLCEFTKLLDGVPGMQTAADSPLVRLAENLTGRNSLAAAFATEGPYYSLMGMDTVILGPGDIVQAHQPDEYLALERIEPTLDVLSKMIHKLCVRDAIG